MHFYLRKWKDVPPTGFFTYTNKQKVPSTYLFTTTRTLIRELRVLESFFFHTSSLLNHSRFQHQLDKFTNEIMLSVATNIKPFPIFGDDTAFSSIINWSISAPILKFQIIFTVSVNKLATFFSPNTNPIIDQIFGKSPGFSINFVIERLSLRFKNSSCFESILWCIFTPFFCISIICSFWTINKLMTETVGNIYY